MSAPLKCQCGSTLFHRKYPARGTWRQIIDTAKRPTQVVESFTDGLRQCGEPKTVTCATCGKRHPNPDYR